MRRAGNIFEQESYRGAGIRAVSGVTLTMIVCSVLSVLAAIGIIANFGAVTARIHIHGKHAVFWIPNPGSCDCGSLFCSAVEMEAAQKFLGVVIKHG